jgi:hypothetical protein
MCEVWNNLFVTQVVVGLRNVEQAYDLCIIKSSSWTSEGQCVPGNRENAFQSR